MSSFTDVSGQRDLFWLGQNGNKIGKRAITKNGCDFQRSDSGITDVELKENSDHDEGSSMKLSAVGSSDSGDSGCGTMTVCSPTNTDGGQAGQFFPNVDDGHSGGRRFYDFYTLENDHLGSGSYACVQTATSIATGEEFAVKLVNKQDQSHTRLRVLREVEIFELCKNHPSIIRLIEWFEDSDFFYMVFEKIHGGSLLTRIQQNSRFTEQVARLVTRDIATALKYLHGMGVAHRDIKPENVLCTDLTKISPVKLCDLDLASKPSLLIRCLSEAFDEPNLVSPVGSAEFLAPEVVSTFTGGSSKYDKKCDMWSLSVIVYIMLCGYPPFFGDCTRDNCEWNQGGSCDDCQKKLFRRIQKGVFFFPEEWDDISHEAMDLIEHLLVRDVSKRYTADDVLKHPWVNYSSSGSSALFPTSLNLCRESQKGVHQICNIFEGFEIHGL